MDGWITFWSVVCLVGFTSFYLSVLWIIPKGAKDIVALLRQLSK